jgi:mannan endo-1,4-beta-mannosidase
MKYFLLKSTIIFWSTFFWLPTCSKDSPTKGDPKPVPQQKTNNILVDSLATAETVALFEKLKSVSQQGVLFGHQDDLAYGIGWEAVPGRSDVKETCGDYPAVYGWDLGDIGNPANLDGVNFENMKNWIKEAHARGGINTISMHLDNPASGGNSWDNSPAVASILPGKLHHAAYLKTLDDIARFLKDLLADDGSYIPIVFRPYHEHNHTWSWWGKSACSTEEYNALWKMTVEYLRDTHEIHHLLYAISPQEITSESQYLERYPGDEWVDIFGMDYYLLWDRGKISHLATGLGVITGLAESRGKVAALTEIGIDKVPINDWWTNYLLAAVTYNEQSKKVAWTLVWRNDSVDHFFGPYPGHSSAPDFLKFYRDSFTIFERDFQAME